MPFKEHRGGGKNGAPFESMASRWDAEWSATSRADFEHLATHQNWRWIGKALPPAGRILEAGCGFAEWVAFLDSKGYEAYGVDNSPVAIQRSLATWPHLRVVQGDLRKLPWADNFFDAIVSFGAVEHDIDGPEAALADLYRVLRPGGRIYCSVPCMNVVRRMGSMALRDWAICNPVIRKLAGRRTDDVQFFEYVFPPWEYRSVLEKTGFEVLDLVPLDPKSPALLRTVTREIHKRWPWFLCHMVGAVCRKPDARPRSM
jgi:SAM-dependent methyltransferase